MATMRKGAPTKSKSGKCSKANKGSMSGSDNSESEHDHAGVIGSAFDGMSYGPVSVNNMSIGQIDEESSSF